MTKKPESGLQRRVRRALETQVGGFWYKIWGGPFQPAGMPDLAGVVRGRACFVEVKRPEGAVSRVQYVRMIELASAGAVVAVVTTPDEAVTIVRCLITDSRLRYCHVCRQIGTPVNHKMVDSFWQSCQHCDHQMHRIPE